MLCGRLREADNALLPPAARPPDRLPGCPAAGAEVVGGEELIARILEAGGGGLDFDKCVGGVSCMSAASGHGTGHGGARDEARWTMARARPDTGRLGWSMGRARWSTGRGTVERWTGAVEHGTGAVEHGTGAVEHGTGY